MRYLTLVCVLTGLVLTNDIKGSNNSPTIDVQVGDTFTAYFTGLTYEVLILEDPDYSTDKYKCFIASLTVTNMHGTTDLDCGTFCWSHSGTFGLIAHINNDPDQVLNFHPDWETSYDWSNGSSEGIDWLHRSN